MTQKVFIMLLFCFCQALLAQVNDVPSIAVAKQAASTFYDIVKPLNSAEEIALQTDRHFYCVDERIYFTASLAAGYQAEDLPVTDWSTVLYVELIRWNGEKLARGKFRLDTQKAKGSLHIPPTVKSGNYYLRAYTKWMRNFPVDAYCYKPIKVVNPFDRNIDTGPSSEVTQSVATPEPGEGNVIRGLKCTTDKSIYGPREKVDLTILLEHGFVDHGTFCISVVKTPGLDMNRYSVKVSEEISGITALAKEPLYYLPETRGLSLSGKIIEEETTEGTVHLSIPENWKHFSSFRINKRGMFHFTLPDFYGTADIYLDAVMENGSYAEILLDNDYCQRSMLLPYAPFALHANEKKIALEMAVNAQLSGMYNDAEVHTSGDDSTSFPFYVRPDRVYHTGDFIQLPTLEEFFFELVREVRTSRVNNIPSVRLVSYNPFPELKPLILLDNIPVRDLDAFLKLSLERIEKIEIVIDPYIVGSQMFSGLICVSTTRRDAAGIELPENSRYLGFEMLSGENFSAPGHPLEYAHEDLRMQNLLLWEPEIKLKSGRSRTLSFFTGHSKGEYTVYIRSIGSIRNPLIYGTCKIVVE